MTAPATPPGPGRSAGAGPILLVEDNPGDALLVTEALEDAPAPWPRYRIRHVPDLASALDAIEDEPPTCVLLDLGLPDASGIEGIDVLQQEHPALPVVVLTGIDDTGVADAALRRGAQEFLTKGAGLTAELLARTINAAVRRAEASEALIESNHQLAAFASMVAHDLRSPLAIASGMLELLQQRAGAELAPETAELVDRSLGAVRRTTELVGALLMYARARRPDDTREPVALDQVVTWAAAAAGLPAEGELVVDGPLPTVVGDEGALNQVLQNLFGNAVRYASADRPLVVQVAAGPAEDGWTTVTVTDNGNGIAPEDRERAFQEGERLGRSTGNGLGLGLPAVRHTVQRYGGRAWIEGAPDGPGTRVCLQLPLAG